MNEDELLTVEAAAARVDADPRYVRLMAKLGFLECERHGYEIRIHAAALATFDTGRKAANIEVAKVLAGALPDETYLLVA